MGSGKLTKATWGSPSDPNQVPLFYVLVHLKVWEPRIPTFTQGCLLQTHSCSRKGHGNSKTQNKSHIWPQLAVCFTFPKYKNEPITIIYPRIKKIRITKFGSAPACRETLSWAFHWYPDAVWNSGRERAQLWRVGTNPGLASLPSSFAPSTPD
jgi:hypothetical protein